MTQKQIDMSRSPPFLLDPSYQSQYIPPQISFTPNIPPTCASQPGQQIPPFSDIWPGPSTSYNMGALSNQPLLSNAPNIPNIPNITLAPDTGATLYDMDSFKQINISTGDLPVSSMTNLSLTDIAPDGMTDSLDRLANNEVNKHLDLR